MDTKSAVATRTKANGRTTERRLIMTVGDKGGSGKSFFTRALAGLHLANNTPDLLLIDGDSTVGSLVKFFGDGGPVEPFSVHGKLDERDRLVNDLLRRGASLVVADMPATSLTRLREIADDYEFVDAVEDAGYRLTVVAPITPYDDSILDLQDTIALCDPDVVAAFDRADAMASTLGTESVPFVPPKARVDYVAVINLGLAEDRTDFALWDAADAYTRRLFTFAGGVQLEFPALRPRIAALLQQHRLSFMDAETSAYLTVTDRGRVQRWNVAVAASLRGAGERLGL